jgi:exosortase/archaeosortase family protein
MIAIRWYLPMQLLAFWPVWRWYVQRMLDQSDEPWGILALLTALLLIARKGVFHQQLSPKPLLLSTFLLGLYIAGYASLPPLLRAVPAVLSVSLILIDSNKRQIFVPGICGLLLLSLPLIASLQFYGGFPIRVVTAFVSSQLLGLLGFVVEPQGTLLLWRGEIIAVDAPCAGIKMLWTALFLNFTLASWRELDFFSTWIGTSFTLFMVFLGNILRATLLFFSESGIIDAPAFAHQAIGTLTFSLVAAIVLRFHYRHDRSYPCVA